MKIMLVDDSRTIRNIQKKVLAQLGHEDIVEASDGVEALSTRANTRATRRHDTGSLPAHGGEQDSCGSGAEAVLIRLVRMFRGSHACPRYSFSSRRSAG